jgi:signal transduction histidine kinase/ActR/RegA family two-component response regulator
VLITKLYIGTISAIGICLFLMGIWPWESANLSRFALYLLLSLLSSGMKVSLPSVQGTLSVSLLFILLSIVELTLPEALVVGCASFFCQYFWKAKSNWQVVKILFNFGNATSSIWVAHSVYHSRWLEKIGIEPYLVLCLVAAAYFLTNAGAVAIVIALTEKRRLYDVWRQCYCWSFPHYMVGAVLVEIFRAVNARIGWQIWVLVMPVAYTIYRSYKLYLEKFESTKREAEIKAQFFANMSHEIRTPMNGVIGMTRLLLDTPQSDEQRDYTETIQRSADGLLRIINDILDFSKIEAGKLTLHSTEFEPGELINTTLKILSTDLRSKGLRVIVDVDPSIGWRKGDAGRLRQVLLNLAGNAVKFTSEGSVTVRAWPAEGDRVRFEVIDTGIGISQKSLGRLFQAFTQVDDSDRRQYGGTGLGLSISQKLVVLMGGEIGVESKIGVGSTFWFSVPLERIAAPVLQDVPVVPVGDVSKNSRSTGHVLVVEDNVINQKVTISLLKKLGHTADIAVNGMEAVEQASRTTYDLILMDCQMPVMDGFEATRQIRMHGNYKNTPIVALTAGAFKSDEVNCLAAGMDAYLSKPVNITSLADVLQRWQKQELSQAHTPSP